MTNTEVQRAKLRFGIIGHSEELLRAIDTAILVAPTDLSVLVTGESGVGKESFPQIIHQYSRRKHAKYIAVNCGAIPEGTIDSELFGHEKGSFTGAIGDRKGYFGEADKGTIFLDEVGELPLQTQARLLRVLETGEFIKVGSSVVEKTDVRIVAATNVNLAQAISEGRFREDLYYRLNTVPIQVPPLRERGNDIVLLFRKFASDFSEKYKIPVVQLTDDAKNMLMSYSWPGNVRELKNVTDHISLVESEREITSVVLAHYLPNRSNNLPTYRGKNAFKGFESEKEALFRMIYDMQKDIDDLKKVVHLLMRGGHGDFMNNTYASPKGLPPLLPIETMSGNEDNKGALKESVQNDSDIENITNQKMTLEEVEKEMIKKALQRHNGKRKYAAQDLNISERTLYRKIKEYGLD